jgi:hypothetical protein
MREMLEFLESGEKGFSIPCERLDAPFSAKPVEMSVKDRGVRKQTGARSAI